MIKTIRNNLILDNKYFKVENNGVLFNDIKEGEHLRIQSKPNSQGIAVLAITTDMEVIIQDEYRYGIGRYVTQVVKGGVLDRQTHEDAAKMELDEELGLECDEFIDLGPFCENPSLMKQNNRAFLALNCKTKENSKGNDGTEAFKNRRKVKLDILLHECLNNKLECAVTQMLILKACFLIDKFK